MVGLQVNGNVEFVSNIKDDETRDAVQTRFVVNPLSDDAALCSCAETGAWNFDPRIATVPAWTSDDKYLLRLRRVAIAPCRPALVRPPRGPVSEKTDRAPR